MPDLVVSRPAGLTLPELAKRNAEQRKAKRAANTIRAHASDWNPFIAWCRAHGVEPLPAPPEAVALYLTHLESQGKRLNTIERSLSTICRKHHDARAYSPRHEPIVEDTIKGLRNTLGTAARQKRPVAAGLLARLIAAAVGEELKPHRDRALLLLGFMGAFRRSELVAFDVADLEFAPGGLRVLLRRGKTDQQGKGRAVWIYEADDPLLCAVGAVRAWIALAGLEEGPLFCALDRGHYGARLRAATVADLVKHYVALAGLDPADYAGHSLRAGFVSSAVRAGKTERAIKRQTGHTSSTMVDRYVRELEIQEENATKGLL